MTNEEANRLIEEYKNPKKDGAFCSGHPFVKGGVMSGSEQYEHIIHSARQSLAEHFKEITKSEWVLPIRGDLHHSEEVFSILNNKIRKSSLIYKIRTWLANKIKP